MFRNYINQSGFSKQRFRSSLFSNDNSHSTRKELFGRSHFDENFSKLLFLSKRGTMRAPFACEVLKKIVMNTEYNDKLGIFYRGVTKVYDRCSIDNRINSFKCTTGITIHGHTQFASTVDIEQADFIIPLDEESMDFAKHHRVRGYLYPITFFQPAGGSGFISDPYEEKQDLDLHYKEIISAITFGCEKIVLSLLPTLRFYDFEN